MSINSVMPKKIKECLLGSAAVLIIGGSITMLTMGILGIIGNVSMLPAGAYAMTAIAGTIILACIVLGACIDGCRKSKTNVS